MEIHNLTPNEWTKSIGVGVANAILLSAIMVPVFAAGIAPMPKQPSLAFAEVIFGRPLPLPVGLLFHVVYVTFWSVAYVALFRDELSLMRALWLAVALWAVALVVFFPINGWGFLGLAVSPKLIVAALVPHLLFAVFLWGLCRMAFRDQAASALR
jgi:hypothetical protein